MHGVKFIYDKNDELYAPENPKMKALQYRGRVIKALKFKHWADYSTAQYNISRYYEGIGSFINKEEYKEYKNAFIDFKRRIKEL